MQRIRSDAVAFRQKSVCGPEHLLIARRALWLVVKVERHSRFAMLIKVPSKETEAVVAALSQHVRKLPVTLRRSLTWDRGLEVAKHKDFTVATEVQVYFCDPQSPWQRGSNENTNGLLRQYFPRRTDLCGYTQADLDQVALRLNQRPRKTLGFQTPASRLQESVASTG
jgi:IS30 family transposase